VSISLEMCKTVLLQDSVVNLPACAKPQEWQVSLKCFKLCLQIVHVIFSLVLVGYNSNSLTINYRNLLWSLFFQLYMCVLIKWSEL
jgi:hypothetical protein